MPSDTYKLGSHSQGRREGAAGRQLAGAAETKRRALYMSFSSVSQPPILPPSVNGTGLYTLFFPDSKDGARPTKHSPHPLCAPLFHRLVTLVLQPPQGPLGVMGWNPPAPPPAPFSGICRTQPTLVLQSDSWHGFPGWSLCFLMCHPAPLHRPEAPDQAGQVAKMCLKKPLAELSWAVHVIVHF